MGFGFTVGWEERAGVKHVLGEALYCCKGVWVLGGVRLFQGFCRLGASTLGSELWGLVFGRWVLVVLMVLFPLAWLGSIPTSEEGLSLTGT